jgi:hypothetical protein
MENLKRIKYSDCNLMVYVKTKESKTFNPLSSLKEMKFAPNLLYACLIPYEKLETLKEWSNQFNELSLKEGVTIQIRSSKDRKKVLHQIN